MLFFDGGVALVVLVLWLFCLFDVITTDASLCRNLPKPVWLLIVLLLPDVGSIIWLVAGHPWQSAQRPGGLPYKGNTGYGNRGYGNRGYGNRGYGNASSSYRSAGYENNPSRGGRPSPGSSKPDDDADFLRQLRERAEQQRRAAPPRPEDPPVG